MIKLKTAPGRPSEPFFERKNGQLYIFLLLGEGKKTVSEICESLELTNSWVTAHVVKFLVRSNLLFISEDNKKFNRKIYSINYHELITEFFKFFLNTERLLQYSEIDLKEISRLGISTTEIQKIQQKLQKCPKHALEIILQKICSKVSLHDKHKEDLFNRSFNDFFYSVILELGEYSGIILNPYYYFYEHYLEPNKHKVDDRERKIFLKEFARHKKPLDYIFITTDPLFKLFISFKSTLMQIILDVYINKRSNISIVQNSLSKDVDSDYYLIKNFPSLSDSYSWFFTDEFIEEYSSLITINKKKSLDSKNKLVNRKIPKKYQKVVRKLQMHEY